MFIPVADGGFNLGHVFVRDGGGGGGSGQPLA